MVKFHQNFIWRRQNAGHPAAQLALLSKKQSVGKKIAVALKNPARWIVLGTG